LTPKALYHLLDPLTLRGISGRRPRAEGDGRGGAKAQGGMDPTTPGENELIYRRTLRQADRPLALNADLILLLKAIDGTRSLAEIAAQTRLPPEVVRPAVKRLLAQGLIEPVPRPPVFPGRRFIQELYQALSMAIGPMARFLLEENMAELRLDPDRLTLAQAAELGNRLALEVPDGNSRLKFKQAILAILNRISSADRSRSP
jgi:DNA-binding MarR family transcriptional regulator